jgi:hypothetical protein
MRPASVALPGRLLERLTYRTADRVIVTNESYRHVALTVEAGTRVCGRRPRRVQVALRARLGRQGADGGRQPTMSRPTCHTHAPPGPGVPCGYGRPDRFEGSDHQGL